MVVAQCAHLLQEAGRGRHHPALALHRLDHHRGHVAGGHRRLQLGDVVEVDVAEATGQRLVAFLVLGLRGGGDRGQGAAVEAAAEGDDHALLRRAALRAGPLAHQLDRRLVGLGAGIAQEHALGEAAGADEFLGKAQRRFAVEDVAGVPQLAGLLDQRRVQVRIVVAWATDRDAGGQVDVLAAFAVPQARTWPRSSTSSRGGGRRAGSTGGRGRAARRCRRRAAGWRSWRAGVSVVGAGGCRPGIIGPQDRARHRPRRIMSARLPPASSAAPLCPIASRP